MKYFVIIILIEFSLVIRGIRKVTKRLALALEVKIKISRGILSKQKIEINFGFFNGLLLLLLLFTTHIYM